MVLCPLQWLRIGHLPLTACLSSLKPSALIRKQGWLASLGYSLGHCLLQAWGQLCHLCISTLRQIQTSGSSHGTVSWQLRNYWKNVPEADA